MKTNQLMTVAFPSGTLDIYHKTATGSLTDLFSLGNRQRVLDGKKPINQTLFIKSKATQEFIRIIAKELNIKESDIVFSKGRGKSSRTYGQLHFLIYAAEKLSPTFHFHVIDIFLSKHLLELRDDGGNVFKALNLAIDQWLPDRKDKQNRGCYIQVAKMLRAKIFPEIKTFDTHINIWNSDIAVYEKQYLREDYEDKLVSFLKAGLIKDWEHLKAVIENLD
jgi:hypothetical protein